MLILAQFMSLRERERKRGNEWIYNVDTVASERDNDSSIIMRLRIKILHIIFVTWNTLNLMSSYKFYFFQAARKKLRMYVSNFYNARYSAS